MLGSLKHCCVHEPIYYAAVSVDAETLRRDKTLLKWLQGPNEARKESVHDQGGSKRSAPYTEVPQN